MLLILLLAVHYGGPHWDFPWWVWIFSVLHELTASGYRIAVHRRRNP